MTGKSKGKTIISEKTLTLRRPRYTYFQLSLNTLPSSAKGTKESASLDELTVRWYLDSALTQFLGLTGAGVPIDILKVENHCIWIRVPCEDGNAVAAAISQWVRQSDGVSLRIVARGAWLGGLLSLADEQQNLWLL